MKGPGVVDVDGGGRYAKNVVLESHQGLIGPDAQAPVLGQAVPADAGARKDHVGMGGPDRGHIIAARQYPLEGMGQERFSILEPPGLKGFLDDGIGHIFGGAGRHGGFDQDQTLRGNPFADDKLAGFLGVAVHGVGNHAGCLYSRPLCHPCL